MGNAEENVLQATAPVSEFGFSLFSMRTLSNSASIAVASPSSRFLQIQSHLDEEKRKW